MTQKILALTAWPLAATETIEQEVAEGTESERKFSIILNTNLRKSSLIELVQISVD